MGLRVINWYYGWISQFSIFARKQFRVTYRSWGSASCLVFCPVVFVLLLVFFERYTLGLIEVYDDAANIVESFPAEPVLSISEAAFKMCPKCTVKLALAPNVAAITDIRTRLLDADADLVPTDLAVYETAFAIDDAIIEHNPQDVFAAVIFTDLPTSYSYAVQFNHTMFSCEMRGVIPNCPDAHRSALLPVQAAVDQAIARIRSGNDTTEYRAGLRSFPHPVLLTSTVTTMYAPFFIFLLATVHVVVFTAQLLNEKEHERHLILLRYGLRPSVYWAVMILSHAILAGLSYAVMVGMAVLLELPMVTANSLTPLALMLATYLPNLIATAVIFAAVLHSSTIGTIVAFMYFIVTAALGSLGQGFFFTSTTHFSVRFVLSFLPPVIFEKGLADLALGETQGAIHFSNMGSYTDSLPIAVIIALLIVNAIGRALIAAYLTSVLPSNGIRRHPLIIRTRPPPPDLPDADLVYLNELRPEVLHERERVINVLKTTDVAARPGIVLHDMRRAVRTGWLLRRFVIIEGLSLTVDRGTVVCLLGQHEAGKTAIINALAGLKDQTAGRIIIDGADQPQPASNRPAIGLCPRADPLWPPLTAREHLDLIGALRGLGVAARAREAGELLEEIGLTDKAGVPVSKYSAGMRRRLTVLMALIGSPGTVLLDEPTTGLDPVTRQQVWETIRRHKEDKAVVLTTHSMEEADVLGDRIAITAAGRLQCVGKSLALKNAFDAGYHIVITCEPGQVSAVLDVVATRTDLDHRGTVGDVVTVAVPRDATPMMSGLVGELDGLQRRGAVAGYKVSITTLEDIFNLTSRSVTRGEHGLPATSSGAAPGSETPSDEASEGSVTEEEPRDLQEAEEEVN